MTKIILAHELLEVGLNKSHIAKHLDVSRRSIIRWSQAIDRHGSLKAFLVNNSNFSISPKIRNKIPGRLSVILSGIFRRKLHLIAANTKLNQ